MSNAIVWYVTLGQPPKRGPARPIRFSDDIHGLHPPHYESPGAAVAKILTAHPHAVFSGPTAEYPSVVVIARSGDHIVATIRRLDQRNTDIPGAWGESGPWAPLERGALAISALWLN